VIKELFKGLFEATFSRFEAPDPPDYDLFEECLLTTVFWHSFEFTICKVITVLKESSSQLLLTV